MNCRHFSSDFRPSGFQVMGNFSVFRIINLKIVEKRTDGKVDVSGFGIILKGSKNRSRYDDTGNRGKVRTVFSGIFTPNSSSCS